MNELFNLFMDVTDTEPERTVIVKAPISFPGSKVDSLPYILPRLGITPKSTWVDVFGGTGVVSLNIPDCKMKIYNDRNSGLVDFYRVLRDRRPELEAYINQMHPWSREEWTNARREWVQETDPVVRAAKWFYHVRVSFSQMGTTFARQTTPLNRIDTALKVFESVSHRFKSFLVENLDCFQCIKDFDSPDTVLYLDPPYLDEGQDGYAHGWGLEEHKKLLSLISECKGRVILSHRPCPHIDSCAFWNERHSWNVRIASTPTGAVPLDTESIWIKYDS